MPSALRRALGRALIPALAAAWSGVALAAAPARAAAQAVLGVGVGEDASVLRAGMLRFGAVSQWLQYRERYGKDTPRRKAGALEPLGVDFSFDTLGLAQFENLAPLQNSIRILAGMPDFVASLGKATTQLRQQVQRSPLSVELGVTNRITLGVTVPLVTATANVSFRVNPNGNEGTLGFNPALAIPGLREQNGALLSQFDSAASQLNRALNNCLALPGSAGCASLVANAASARALIQNSTAFAAAFGAVYGGRNGGAGAPFVPTAGSTAQLAVASRVAAFRSLYGSFGNFAINRDAPGGAAPFTATDAQRLLTDSLFGIRAKPLATSITRGTGDIDFLLKINVFDSFGGDITRRIAPKGFNVRQSFGGVYRLGTGKPESADDFTDIGAGDHQNDVEVRSYTDLLFGSHFWLSVVAKYNRQMADQLTMRIAAAPSNVFAAAYRKQTVQRDLGDVTELEINPRWAFTEQVGISAHYYYRHKAADRYSGSFSVNDLNGAPIALDASLLNQETEAFEHRFGGGVSYSTVAAFSRGDASAPYEVSYFHYQTTLGSGGNTPKLTQDQVQFRFYTRLFGR